MLMEEAALSPLARWENFYVIIGSSAGALTGLQFVVIALIAESRTPGGMREIRDFGSPTIVPPFGPGENNFPGQPLK